MHCGHFVVFQGDIPKRIGQAGVRATTEPESAYFFGTSAPPPPTLKSEKNRLLRPQHPRRATAATNSTCAWSLGSALGSRGSGC